MRNRCFCSIRRHALPTISVLLKLLLTCCAFGVQHILRQGLWGPRIYHQQILYNLVRELWECRSGISCMRIWQDQIKCHLLAFIGTMLANMPHRLGLEVYIRQYRIESCSKSLWLPGWSWLKQPGSSDIWTQMVSSSLLCRHCFTFHFECTGAAMHGGQFDQGFGLPERFMLLNISSADPPLVSPVWPVDLEDGVNAEHMAVSDFLPQTWICPSWSDLPENPIWFIPYFALQPV